jgi:tRNA-2-methylthio-N6-dimethylallyladenosine synthase
VIEGCNKNCSFCVVPRTRGRERNRRLADVVAEVRGLVEQGAVEVELLGQTVNAFRDPGTGEDFADLLRAVGRVDGLRRLRFVTSHPRNFDLRLVRTMAETEVVCPALHLPVQSGSTRVLSRMKRQYDREEYLSLVDVLKREIPGLSLYTDVIVGFPGETEVDFEATLSLVEEVRYAGIFSFCYSPRPQTAAARWENDVTPAEASARLRRLQERQQEIQRETNERLVGKVLSVLVEGDDRSGKRSSGRSPGHRVVNVDGPRRISPGAFVDVLVERGFPNSLLGRPARSGDPSPTRA